MLFASMNKSTSILLLFLAVFCSNIRGQESSGLRGYVTDKNKDTLAGAVISAGNKSAITDLHGFYSLKLDTGSYVLRCDLSGYKTFTVQVNIGAGENSELGIV